MRAGGELDRLRAQQRLGQQQIRCTDRLPRHGEVFADPGFDVAELVGQFDDVEIPLGGVVEGALRRMGRHEEYSDLHGQPFLVLVVGPGAWACATSERIWRYITVLPRYFTAYKRLFACEFPCISMQSGRIFYGHHGGPPRNLARVTRSARSEH